jgi:hypothetical protein
VFHAGTVRKVNFLVGSSIEPKKLVISILKNYSSKERMRAKVKPDRGVRNTARLMIVWAGPGHLVGTARQVVAN